jgi:anti-anti-sigma factor
MNVESRREGKAAVVTVSGRMDAASAPQFESVCEQFLAAGVTHVIVGMADLQYVSSMGLRSFLVLAKQAKAKGGDLYLCGMKGFVKEVFDMTHVTQLFPLHETTDAALQSV